MYSYLDSFVVIEEVIFKRAPVFISYRDHKLENKTRKVFLRSFFYAFGKTGYTIKSASQKGWQLCTLKTSLLICPCNKAGIKYCANPYKGKNTENAIKFKGNECNILIKFSRTAGLCDDTWRVCLYLCIALISLGMMSLHEHLKMRIFYGQMGN